jgi:dTDP-4-dehydrorhamnose 3,5-epimerase-like enzyme
VERGLLEELTEEDHAMLSDERGWFLRDRRVRKEGFSLEVAGAKSGRDSEQGSRIKPCTKGWFSTLFV